MTVNHSKEMYLEEREAKIQYIVIYLYNFMEYNLNIKPYISFKLLYGEQ